MSADLNHYYLQQMGIQIWTERSERLSEGQLFYLEQIVSKCMTCARHQTRCRPVFAKGNPQAKLMIIGDVPSEEDEQAGLPFSGKAGILLQQMLSSISLSDADVYMTNVLKCKAFDNPMPTAEEIASCEGHLLQQIVMVKPSVLLLLGDIARDTALKNKFELPFVATCHPNHLLQYPADKKQVFSALLSVRNLLSGY